MVYQQDANRPPMVYQQDGNLLRPFMGWLSEDRNLRDMIDAGSLDATLDVVELLCRDMARLSVDLEDDP